MFKNLINVYLYCNYIFATSISYVLYLYDILSRLASERQAIL